MFTESTPCSSGIREGVSETYDMGDNGYIRFERYDDCIFVHPVPVEYKISILRALKEELETLIPLYLEYYNYDLAWFYTHDERLHKFYGGDKIEKWGDVEDGSLYYYDRRI